MVSSSKRPDTSDQAFLFMQTFMFLINGIKSDSISVQDRGFNYGDGLFTTIRIHNSKPQLWELHAQRLIDGCIRFRFPFPDIDNLYLQLLSLVSESGLDQACGKIVISRGTGGRGYSISGCDHPTLVVSVHPYPLHYEQWNSQGIEIGIAEQRIGISPILAGMKSLNRLEQVFLKAELDERGLKEALVLDVNGSVIEGVTSNIFWRKGNDIFTPDLKLSGVYGVMRAFVCSVLEQENRLVQIVNSDLNVIKAADEIWITNALMGIVPITGIEDVRYQDHRMAKHLQTLLATMA